MVDVSSFSRYKLLILTALVEGTVLMIALICAGYYDIKFLPLTHNILRDIAAGTSGAILPLILFVFLLSERSKNIPFLGSLRRTIIDDISIIFKNAGLIDICLISLSAGIAEELLFRGVIQTRLGIAVASIIFGLLHFITPAYCVIATIMGLYIGVLYLYYDSLLVPIQLHFIYDLGALIILRYCVMTDRK